ncbi:MAG: hypothetical protein JNK67_16280 [Alphaproteobacteria bacterium]|nr:hypothetical protein [Alphaproteobacteria bacterium]
MTPPAAPDLARHAPRPERWRLPSWRAALVGAAALVGGCAGEPSRDTPTEPAAVTEAPIARADTLLPGLAVRYWPVMIRNLRELAAWQGRTPAIVGPAIDGLDHVMGDGAVLTSGIKDGVAAEITGFIHLPAAGRYAFAAVSNDGVRVEIAGAVVVDDPDVHADRRSPPRAIVVRAAGWYPLRVLYFERRNTATLQLYWQPPDATAPAIVPAGALRRPRESG